ncbi:MAG: hypothetical protein ACI9WU_000265 [Myxococcota bacterium]|jgi:uncharacterized protein YfaS (alpha-2-macroglobulin family)
MIRGTNSIRLTLVGLALLMAIPAVAQPNMSTPKKKVPTGAIDGLLVRRDNAEPIGRQWLTLKRPGWSRSASTDTFGRFTFGAVPDGLDYTVSFYHNGYRVRSFGPFEVRDGKEVDVGKLEAIAVAAQVAPYTYSDTFLPGQNITVMVRSIRVSSVDVEVYKIPMAVVKQRLGKLTDHKNMVLDASWKPMLTYRQPVSGGHQLRWRTTRVEPAFQEAGFYIVRVAGAGKAKLIPLVVTQLSLISKRAPNATWVWATDLDTGEPRKGVTILGEGTAKDAHPPASLLNPGKSRKDGLRRFSGKHAKNIRYWGFQGDNIAYVDTVPASAAQSLSFRTYVYTDRPAYRPGDLVNYKVIARANDGGVYRVKPGEKWSVAIRDVEGQIVHRADHESNLFGTFHGQFTLGETPALGTWSVEARSEDKVQSGRFKVLEYRKPEYALQVSTKQKQFVQGKTIEVGFAANYYFGAPLTGAKVTWTAYETPFRPWWYDSYWGAYEGGGGGQGYGRVARSGTVTLDSRGQAQLKLNVDRASVDRWVTIEAVVADSTNREVSARHKVMVSRGTFRLGIRPNGRIFQVGETAAFDVEATGFDGTASDREVQVTASLETFNTKHKIWIYETLDTRTIQTAGGKAKYKFPVQRDGFVRVEVKGRDKYDNPIVESTFIWATKDKTIAGGYKKKSLDILPDQKSYKPGDTARILVNTSRPDPWVLFTVEGDGVFEPSVVKVKGNSRLFELKLTAKHAPNVYASVAFAAGKSFYSLSKSIDVSPAHRLLKVKLTADKAVYEPGKTAVWTAHVTDRKGKPVEAELSISLVDEAVYAISKELAPPIGRFFYGHRPNPVRTAFSFPSRYLGGADKDGDDDAGGGVRRDFKDTAFWKAVVHTDTSGKATINVPLPDNLTTWRLTARAITRGDTLVGAGTAHIRTSKDLLATLALPRFFRRGDRIEVVSMIHNRGEDLNDIKVKLEVVGPGASIDGPAASTFSLKGATSRAVRWSVEVGNDAGSLSGHDKPIAFRVSAKGGRFFDAEERTVPVHAVKVDRLEAVSGMTQKTVRRTFVVPKGHVPGTVSLSLRAAPSLAGAVVESLEDLANFPYGCVEQTMNTFLPDLVAEKVLQELKVPRTGKLRDLDAMMRRGLRNLYSMQHSDGGWGWWTDDPTHPFMTAYVVYGLSRAKYLGRSVREDVLKRGVRSAIRQFRNAPDINTRSFLVYAVAHSPKTRERDAFLRTALSEVTAKVDALNSYSLATLILAHVAGGKVDGLEALVDRLEKRAEVAGDTAHFPGRAWHYTWTDNDKEATAYAMRALVAARPNSPLISQSLRWLLARRRGGMWDTTKDTAAALEAITALITTNAEMMGRYAATVLVNGIEVTKLTVRPDNVLHAGLAVDVPAKLLDTGDNTLEVKMDGKGTFYWTGALRYGASTKSRAQGMGVIREYFKVVRTTAKRGQKIEYQRVGSAGVEVGDEVEARITLFTDRDTEYVAIEDPIPAGWEVLPGEARRSYSRREVRDEKVAFFVTRARKGKLELVYRLRAEMAGQVAASPTTAWLMYSPEVHANSAKDVLVTHPKALHAAK